jgi:hypothetical protein
MTTAARETPSIPSPVADFNPIGWGQFHLRGGWKSFWPVTLGYTALVGLGLLLMVRLADPNAALPGLKLVFLGLQGGLMVLFVTTRVATAIRQDLTNKMIESHRLMPVSPAQAVLGYLVGPSAQPMALCAANLLLGCGLCQATGTPLPLWFTVNAVLRLFTAFAVTLGAFGAFTGRPGGAAVGWIGSFVGLLNIITIGAILPGVNVLATPFLGSTIFNMPVAGRDAIEVYAPSTVFQALIAGACFAGACRRYRRDDRPALGWDLGLLLLSAWVATSAYGMLHWQDVGPSMMRMQPVKGAAQLLGSVISSMLLALVPLAGSASQSMDWERRTALGDPSAGRRPPAPPVVALAAAGVTLALAAAGCRQGATGHPRDAVIRTAAVLLCFFLSTSYVLRILARVATKFVYPLMAWFMLSSLIPICVDYAGWWVRGARLNDWALGTASGFGPIGALVQAWGDNPAATTPGLAFQAALAAGLAAAYYGTRSRWRPKAVPPRDRSAAAV